MQEPLVSVIVPVYNTEKYVARAVESIQNQIYTNIEILLVNDGSTDCTEKECLKCAEKDSRIRYFWKENGGVSSARNLALKEAKGEYITFCDSDDAWRDDLLLLAVRHMQEGEYDMVRFGFKSQDETLYPSDNLPELVIDQKELLIEYFTNGVIYRNMLNSTGGIYKNEIIKEKKIVFNEELKIGEDSEFVIQYTLCCGLVRFINEQPYYYYQLFEDRDSATAKNIKVVYNEYEIFDMIFKLIYLKWDAMLSIEEKRKGYAGFYDKVIGRLVRFATYSTEQTKAADKRRLSRFLNQNYVIEAGKWYQRKRDTDSRVIPFLMKRRWINLLWIALRSKRKKYYQMYGKKQYVESIWKKDQLINME